MNARLKSYVVDVQFPNVSGAELLETLRTRDELAVEEKSLTVHEQRILREADQRLYGRAEELYAELARFVDLKAYRAEQGIARERFWWYLDEICEAMLEVQRLRERDPAQYRVSATDATDRRYYKLPDDEAFIPEWGTPVTWYFELNEQGDAERQICVYQNGKATKHDRSHDQDEFGALMVMVTQKGEEWQLQFETTREEFEHAWREYPADNRTLTVFEW